MTTGNPTQPNRQSLDSLRAVPAALPVVPISPAKPAEPISAPPPAKKEEPKTSPWYKKRWVYYAAGAAVLVAVVAVVTIHLATKHAPVARAAVIKPTPLPTPVPVYYPLTGLPATTAAAAAQPVVGVMIENLYPNARPQSGLGSAGVVYEALAEGGITRFLSIYQEPLPVSLGPVRSLRPYYLDWGLEYGIPVAHAGGSQPALAAIGPLGMKDINALVYDGSYFLRTTDRLAPHNLYTNSNLLAQIVAKLGFATAPTFAQLPRKTDAPEAAPTHPVININFSTQPYSVKYTFNPTSDSYARVMGGVAHIDRNTGLQIQVKNIVLEYVPTSYGTQDDGKPETDYNLIGSGKAVVFTDGGATIGTWNKASDSAPTKLLDSIGNPISFNRGNVWYEVIPTGNAVTY